MGIEAKFRKVFKFTYAAKYNGQFGENEIDTVYRGEYSGKVKPNPKETADYKWVEIRELKRDINKNPEKYTPWLKLILKKLKF
jgi:isopentenyl-diphosphate delta-isomerase